MNGKRPRMTVHVDLSLRKQVTKKRKYEVAFRAQDDPCFNQPIVRAKRIRLSNDQSMADDSSSQNFKSQKSAKSEEAK